MTSFEKVICLFLFRLLRPLIIILMLILDKQHVERVYFVTLVNLWLCFFGKIKTNVTFWVYFEHIMLTFVNFICIICL